MDATEAPPRPRKGRGAVGNATGRFESEVRHAFDDGWGSLDEEPLPLDTTYTRDSSRSTSRMRRVISSLRSIGW